MSIEQFPVMPTESDVVQKVDMMSEDSYNP